MAVAPRDRLDLRAALDDVAHLVRQRDQIGEQLARALLGQRAGTAAEVDPQQRDGDQLGGERLGRRDTDLRTGMRVERVIGEARDRGLDDVRDRKHLRALLLGLADRFHRIERLARLADRDHQVTGADDRIAIAELRGEVDLDRNAGERFDDELADHRGVIARATRDEDDPLDVLHIELDAIERDVIVLEIDAADQRVRDGAGLLVDLLEHVVLEAALLRLRGGPGDGLGLAGVDVALEVHQRDAVALDDDHLAFLDEDHAAGLAEDRSDIGRHVVLAIAEPNHQRRRVLGGDEQVRLVVAHHHERIAAADLAERAAHRRGQVRRAGGQRVVDEVGEDLGVGLRGELRAGGGKLLP